jgi:hypothetical protein
VKLALTPSLLDAIRRLAPVCLLCRRRKVVWGAAVWPENQPLTVQVHVEQGVGPPPPGVVAGWLVGLCKRCVRDPDLNARVARAVGVTGGRVARG